MFVDGDLDLREMTGDDDITPPDEGSVSVGEVGALSDRVICISESKESNEKEDKVPVHEKVEMGNEAN